VSLSKVLGAHNADVAARSVRAFEGHVRLARVVHPPEVRAARAARSDPPRSRRARHPARDGHARGLRRARGRSARADRWPSLAKLLQARGWRPTARASRCSCPASRRARRLRRALSQRRVRGVPVRRHKGSDDVVAKLSPFRGTLTADAEHRFNAGLRDWSRDRSRLQRARPPQVPRRRADAARAREGGRHLHRRDVRRRGGRAGGRSPWTRRCALTGNSTSNQSPTFATWLAAVEPTLLPSDPLTTAVGYYRKHWDALTRFIDDPQVPIDNSPTEREFQNFAKLRLNMLFAGSTEGAHRACVLLGIVATCRAIGVPVQAYLTWVFERLGTHREDVRPRARGDHARRLQGRRAADDRAYLSSRHISAAAASRLC
jgi:hypothetical protein